MYYSDLTSVELDHSYPKKLKKNASRMGDSNKEFLQCKMSNTSTKRKALKTKEILPLKIQRMANFLDKQNKPFISQDNILKNCSYRKRHLWKVNKLKERQINFILKKVGQMQLLPKFFKRLFLNIVHNQERKPQNKLWTKLNKCIALGIYVKSPMAFMYLKKILPMPSVSTMQQLQNFKMEPGIYPQVIGYLEKEGIRVGYRSKLCVLLFGVMTLEKNLMYNSDSNKIDGFVDLGSEEGRSHQISDHVLVFMLQGVQRKFKQPIAHYFVNDKICTEKLDSIIKSLILSLRNVGYTVIATVCNQRSYNINALNSLKALNGIPIESNYFEIDSDKIYIIFDVPHLFKSIRNVFMSAGELKIDDKIGKWEHLVQLEEDKQGTIRFQKISELHIKPTGRSKKRVKLAAQLFSYNVASVLMLLSKVITDKEMGNEMYNTAKVIGFLDRLFDCTNGPSSDRDITKNYRQRVRKNSFHHRFWMQCLSKLKNTHFRNFKTQRCLKNIKCVNGYITTIISLQDIWKYLVQKKIVYLNLRRLNLDSLEIFFQLIRQLRPVNKHLTCHNFQSVLKASIIMRMRYYRDSFTTCEKDDSKMLYDYHDLVFKKP